MRLNKNAMKKIVREHMNDSDAGHYVPVQKLTVAMCMKVLADYCGECPSRRTCEKQDCVLSVTAEKLVDAISGPAMFDEDFNILQPPSEKGEGK